MAGQVVSGGRAWSSASSTARRRAALSRLAASLEGLSPLAVLGRGYALVWDEAAGRLVRDAAEVDPGQGLRIRLHRGALRATVLSRETE